MSRHLEEEFAKSTDQLTPCCWFDRQAIENGRSILWGETMLAWHTLAGCPIQELQIGVNRHRKPSKVAIIAPRDEPVSNSDQTVAKPDCKTNGRDYWGIASSVLVVRFSTKAHHAER